jgi:hypothetical protein
LKVTTLSLAKFKNYSLFHIDSSFSQMKIGFNFCSSMCTLIAAKNLRIYVFHATRSFNHPATIDQYIIWLFPTNETPY